jgi:hypothetical protein
LAIRKLLVCAAALALALALALTLALALAVATNAKIAIAATPLHEQLPPNNAKHEAPHRHPAPPPLLILQPSSSTLRLIIRPSSSLAHLSRSSIFFL